MAFSFPAPTTSDIIKTYTAAFVAKVVAFLNAIPGGNITDGTVTNAKLAKTKAVFDLCLPLNGGADLGAASVTYVAGWRVPYLDGASASTFRIMQWSFHAGDGGAAVTRVAGDQLLVQVDGSTQITIDLNAADAHGNTLAAGTPILSASNMSLVSLTSGQRITINYTYNGAGASSYPNPELHLTIAAVHVSGV